MNDQIFEKLIAYELDELSTEDRQAVQKLLDTDAAIESQFKLVQQLMTTIGLPELDDAPQSVIRQLKQLYRTRKPTLAQTLRQGVEHIIASLEMDSRLSPALVGFRGCAQTAHLVFESTLGEVDLQLTPGDESETQSWTVQGQVDTDKHPCGVQLVSMDEEMCDPSTSARTDCTCRGRFTLSTPPGTYVLMVDFDDAQLEVGPIQIP